MMNYIYHTLNTIFGMYQEPYSDEWDEKLNLLLREGTIERFDNYTIDFHFKGSIYTVWAGNAYYSFGHLYARNGNLLLSRLQFRPKFRTMLKLKKLKEQLLQKRSDSQFDKLYGDLK